VPLLGGLTVAYVQTVGGPIIQGVQRYRLARLFGIGLLLAGSLQFFAPWRHSHAISQLIAGRGSCPDMTALDIYGSPTQFYRCVNHFMWRVRPNIFDDLVQMGLTWSTVGWFVGFCGCLVLWLFIAVPRKDSRSDSTSPPCATRSAKA
jgi:hypothetical protein